MIYSSDSSSRTLKENQTHVCQLPGLHYPARPSPGRPREVKTVVEWHILATHKQLQHFLGFANFYRRFSHNYRQVTSPPSSLQPVHFSGHPKQAGPLASSSGFSPQSSSSQIQAPRSWSRWMHPTSLWVRSSLGDKVQRLVYAFFSHHLTPAKTNYDVGNRELLTVKLALEEWQHWLEGAVLPFVVWTDRKNLAYIQSAKRLNSRQAQWALFFSRFDFTLTHRHGSCNIKPDALSCLFDAPRDVDNILPTS
ncbi:hypothetical protein L3Q82_020990 [Scortum barcoo]|uniref:Uncharacterized protein n=1 Tax=Scortum barcoo TaxID=214431 RepID=A0ACB8VAD5_9TELE|nr:hypothetical protein L3Q82_020990 [Scortum barcoo]